MKTGIKVFAPATISNLGPGFNTLALALENLGDEIIITAHETPGVHITSISGDKGKLSQNTLENLAGLAAQYTLDHFIAEGICSADTGLGLDLRKKVAIGSGLGSSASSAVAGAMAVNEYFRTPLEKRQLLPFIQKAELTLNGSNSVHAISASLLGGLTLTRDHDSLDIHRLFTPRGLSIVSITPDYSIMSKAALAQLSPNVSLEHAKQQAANLAALVTGLAITDLGLISRSMLEHLVEPQLAQHVKGFAALQSAALAAGAWGCGISGTGPSVYALCPNSFVADKVVQALQTTLDGLKVYYSVHISGINHEGAVKC
jgi:homoserine kinase